MPDGLVSSAGEALVFRDTQVDVVSGQGASLEESVPWLREALGRLLPVHGGVLLRGFAPPSVAAFRSVVSALCGDPLRYEFASTPRSKVAEGVYTSTEYPADQWIPQHNEQSYTTRWPLCIAFMCVQPALSGGATPVTDSRRTYARLDPALRDRFAARKLMYVRNYGNGLDLTWQAAFGTSDAREVEAFCQSQGIACEWVDEDHLRTRQVCQAASRHPVTGEMVWFNQAHLFHVSALAPDIRDALLDAVPEEDLPRNVLFGDGGTIDEGALEAIRGEYVASLLCFDWQAGDVLFLDNMLMAHGRAPFDGPRRVLVAMTGAHSDAA